MRRQNRVFFNNRERAFLDSLKLKRERKWARVRTALLNNIKMRNQMQIGLYHPQENYLYFPIRAYLLKGSRKLFARVKVGMELKVRQTIAKNPCHVFQIDLVTIAMRNLTF